MTAIFKHQTSFAPSENSDERAEQRQLRRKISQNPNSSSNLLKLHDLKHQSSIEDRRPTTARNLSRPSSTHNLLRAQASTGSSVSADGRTSPWNQSGCRTAPPSPNQATVVMFPPDLAGIPYADDEDEKYSRSAGSIEEIAKLSHQNLKYPSPKKPGFAERVWHGLRTVYKALGLKHLLPLITITVYTMIGACIFTALEGPNSEKRRADALVQWQEARDEHSSIYQSLMRSPINEKNLTDRLDELYNEYDSKIVALSMEQALPWNFINAMYFCGTLYTTIGYGNMFPLTTAGRIITVIYAVIGLPIVFLAMSDLRHCIFTFLQHFIFHLNRLFRRLFRKRHQSSQLHVTSSLVSQSPLVKSKPEPNSDCDPDPDQWENESLDGADNASIPVSLALCTAFGWIFFCAGLFCIWEQNWTFGTSVYFIFISFTTIGLGDVTPDHPEYMIAVFYLVIIGLSLVSLCIDVIQRKLRELFMLLLLKLLAEYQKKLEIGGGDVEAAAGMLDVWRHSKSAKFLMPLLSSSAKQAVVQRFQEEAKAQGVEVPAFLTKVDGSSGLPKILTISNDQRGSKNDLESGSGSGTNQELLDIVRGGANSNKQVEQKPVSKPVAIVQSFPTSPIPTVSEKLAVVWPTTMAERKPNMANSETQTESERTPRLLSVSTSSSSLVSKQEKPEPKLVFQENPPLPLALTMANFEEMQLEELEDLQHSAPPETILYCERCANRQLNDVFTQTCSELKPASIRLPNLGLTLMAEQKHVLKDHRLVSDVETQTLATPLFSIFGDDDDNGSKVLKQRQRPKILQDGTSQTLAIETTETGCEQGNPDLSGFADEACQTCLPQLLSNESQTIRLVLTDSSCQGNLAPLPPVKPDCQDSICQTLSTMLLCNERGSQTLSVQSDDSGIQVMEESTESCCQTEDSGQSQRSDQIAQTVSVECRETGGDALDDFTMDPNRFVETSAQTSSPLEHASTAECQTVVSWLNPADICVQTSSSMFISNDSCSQTQLVELRELGSQTTEEKKQPAEAGAQAVAPTAQFGTQTLRVEYGDDVVQTDLIVDITTSEFGCQALINEGVTRGAQTIEPLLSSKLCQTNSTLVSSCEVTQQTDEPPLQCQGIQTASVPVVETVCQTIVSAFRNVDVVSQTASIEYADRTCQTSPAGMENQVHCGSQTSPAESRTHSAQTQPVMFNAAHCQTLASSLHSTDHSVQIEQMNFCSTVSSQTSALHIGHVACQTDQWAEPAMTGKGMKRIESEPMHRVCSSGSLGEAESRKPEKPDGALDQMLTSLRKKLNNLRSRTPSPEGRARDSSPKSVQPVISEFQGFHLGESVDEDSCLSTVTLDVPVPDIVVHPPGGIKPVEFTHTTTLDNSGKDKDREDEDSMDPRAILDQVTLRHVKQDYSIKPIGERGPDLRQSLKHVERPSKERPSKPEPAGSLPRQLASPSLSSPLRKDKDLPSDDSWKHKKQLARDSFAIKEERSLDKEDQSEDTAGPSRSISSRKEEAPESPSPRRRRRLLKPTQNADEDDDDEEPEPPKAWSKRMIERRGTVQVPGSGSSDPEKWPTLRRVSMDMDSQKQSEQQQLDWQSPELKKITKEKLMQRRDTLVWDPIDGLHAEKQAPVSDLRKKFGAAPPPPINFATGFVPPKKKK